MKKNLEMRFDPGTIEHLGVKMYSTLPPALAELISNAYDADAENVNLKFVTAGSKKTINVKDDGIGMSSSDIQDKFLVIGRNRRAQDGDKPTERFGRYATGKKGLGKLALFGLAKVITVDTIHDGKRNRFSLNWDALLSSEGTYQPAWDLQDKATDKANGTTISLSDLKRQSPFDVPAVADSLSKIFIVDEDFKIVLDENGKKTNISAERRYSSFDKEFEWDVASLAENDESFSQSISGALYTSKTPVKPSSGLRGVSLFSRGKLVNAPEYFSDSTSSHFYQYLTGWISVDFIDTLDVDVISTNRQSVDWDHPDMVVLRSYLSSLINRVKNEWRELRKEKKEKDLEEKTGIDTVAWIETLPAEMQGHMQSVINHLSKEEALEEFTPVIKALHEIIPEYPMLHWRHLDDVLRENVKDLYVAKMYGMAADQGTKIYFDYLRQMTGLDVDGTTAADRMFAGEHPLIKITPGLTATDKNIQAGHHSLSRGIAQGFRNPSAHEPAHKLVPGVFSELDCLNILSLVSYLVARAKKGEVTKKD